MKKKNLEESVIQEASAENFFKEETELFQVMQNMDSDTVDASTKMSSIDFNARLNSHEIQATLVIDELTRLGILPDNLGLTRQKKRLSISLDGKGREEKVRIVQGEREARAGGGIGDKLKSLFSRRE